MCSQFIHLCDVVVYARICRSRSQSKAASVLTEALVGIQGRWGEVSCDMYRTSVILNAEVKQIPQSNQDVSLMVTATPFFHAIACLREGYQRRYGRRFVA
jgi:hypothetical protein